MIAENKTEFFEQLGRELEKLGVEDTSELFSDLEQHFAEGERRGVPESEICRELGSIAEIARSCLDLKSSAINSMVARDVSRKKVVSLTKPGRSIPADPSLAKNREGGDAQSDNGDNGDYVRSVTPEHIFEESAASAPQSAASGSASADGTASSRGAESGANSAANSSASSADASGNTGGTSASNAAPNNGMFEKIGKTVDDACDRAGKALGGAFNKASGAVNTAFGKANEAVNNAANKTGKAVGKAAGLFRPTDSYRKNINKDKKGGDLPPQFGKVKTAGDVEFIDVSNLEPNPNGARLLGEILLDVFLWWWLILLVFVLVLALFAGWMALLGLGISSLIGNAGFGKFTFQTRVLFALGFWCLSSAVMCLAIALVKPAFSLIGYVIKRHAAAYYDI